MGRLEGKVAVITGATGGMGQVGCRVFCEEGATVVGVDLDDTGGPDLEQELRDKGLDFSFVGANVATAAGCAAVADHVRERSDRLDVLYNNHGITVGKPILETSEADWDLIQDVDLKSVFLMTKALAPMMTDRGGSIINVSSIGGVVAFGAMGAYGAAKAGVILLSKCCAVDLAQYGIRVNAVCPGVIDTPMPRNFIKDLPDKESIWKGFEEGHLVGRLGRPEEVVSLAVWLGSDESTFMTGAELIIDGGWSVR